MKKPSARLEPSSPFLLSAPICELPITQVPISAPMRKFLSHLAQDPDEALRSRQRRTPKFCHNYFDLCNASALECDRKALELDNIDLAKLSVLNFSLQVLQRSPLGIFPTQPAIRCSTLDDTGGLRR